MRDEIKDFLKAKVKGVIPKKRIVAAILQAEKSKGTCITLIKDQENRLNIAVEFVIAKLPFPISTIVSVCKDVVVEAVTEAVQETFNEIKDELNTNGFTGVL